VRKKLHRYRIRCGVNQDTRSLGSAPSPTSFQIYFDSFQRLLRHGDRARPHARIRVRGKISIRHIAPNPSPISGGAGTSRFPRGLREYLYIPLGGNRHCRARTYANLILTMLLGGLWHGASWNYVIWGGIHGSMLAFERSQGRESFYHNLPRALRVALTFLIVMVAWVFLSRARSQRRGAVSRQYVRPAARTARCRSGGAESFTNRTISFRSQSPRL